MCLILPSGSLSFVIYLLLEGLNLLIEFVLALLLHLHLLVDKILLFLAVSLLFLSIGLLNLLYFSHLFHVFLCFSILQFLDLVIKGLHLCSHFLLFLGLGLSDVLETFSFFN